MSGALDTKAKKLAFDKISKFGGLCVYTQIGEDSVYDIATQTNIPDVTTNLDVPFLFEKMSFGALQSGIADMTDLLIGIPYLSIDTIKSGDTVTIDNISYVVKTNLPVSSGSGIAYHRVIIKAM